MGAEHYTDTAADPRPRVCQLAVCTSCGRVTKRWPEISLRLQLVLDSEKEVDLPTESSPQWMNGWPSVQPTHTLRRDQPAHTYSCSTRVTQPAFRSTRGLTHTVQSSTNTFLNPLPTYQTPPPSYLPEFFGLCLSFWKWERDLTRDQSSRASQRSVSPSCSHPSFSPFILRFSVLVVSATVSKGNQKSNPLTSSYWWSKEKMHRGCCILGKKWCFYFAI